MPQDRRKPTESTAPDERAERRRNFRMNLIRLFFAAATVYLCVGIVRIKADFGDEYEQRAKAQLINYSTESDKAIQPNRGSIYDRNDKSFAMAKVVYSVFIDVRILTQQTEEVQQAAVEALNEALGMNPQDVWALLAVDEDGKPAYDTNYLVIARQVERKDAMALMSLVSKKKTKCIYIEDDTLRYYTQDTVAPQVIGFVRGGGNWGLEAYYDKELTGLPGRVFRSYDASGSVVTERVDPEEGYKLITTLDSSMQQTAERLCKEYGDLYEALNSSIVIMQPYTGEILTMAQYPTFSLTNPLDLSYVNRDKFRYQWQGLPDAQLVEKMSGVWSNFNISKTFEPGSIFKPFTVAMALEEGIIKTTDTYDCAGVKVVSGIPIRCHYRKGHGKQTLTQAIANSCNVAMMDIAAACGRTIFAKYQRDFGFAENTGIDLPSEANAASLVYPEYMLNPVELATYSFGQGFNTTAIQNMAAFAAAINGGNLLVPYVVSQMQDERGNTVYRRDPIIAKRVISEATSDYLRTAMESVFSPSATGYRAIIPGYSIGGKTGTAQQGKREDEIYSVFFMAYLPVDKPEYLVLASIDRPELYEDGKTTAAYMLKDMLQYIIEYKGLKPDKLDADTNDTNGLIELAEFNGSNVADAVAFCNANNLDFELIGGSGAVVSSMFPRPGALLQPGTKVFFTIREEYGFELAEIPDVKTLTEAEAKGMLSGVGFVPIVRYEKLPTDPAELTGELAYAIKGTVKSQMPEAGNSITAGSEVTIIIHN